MSGHGDKPTLLMVGSGDAMDAALMVALDRHGLFVETVALEGLEASVHLTAPDVILLVGDAAEEGGLMALTMLAGDPSTAAVPVVLLAKDQRLESRMHAFRHGAMAVVPRSASADAIARRVVQLQRELSEHFEPKTGEIGEATFDELIDLVKKELRSGILSVHKPGDEGSATRVVLGAGRPVAAAVQEFVDKLRPHVKEADPIHYQFHTSAGGPVGLLELGSTASTEMVSLPNLRVLVVDDDPQRADTIAQELRQRGALVFVTDTKGSGIQRAEGLDPQVAIIDSAGLQGDGFEVVRRIRQDMRLRWASMLVAPWEEIWPEQSSAPNVHGLATRIEPLLASERDLAERTATGAPFDVRLEGMGPSRMLRVLVESGATLHLTVRNPKARVEVDIAEGLVVGAISHLEDGSELAGTRSLGSLLALGSGRVHIEHRANPAVANVMSPVDEALSAATDDRDDLRQFTSFAEDEPAHEAQTAVKNLQKLARQGESILGGMGVSPTAATQRSMARPRPRRSSVPRPTKPKAPPPRKKLAVPPPRPKPLVGGPVAAGERRLKKGAVLRKKTLAMGALLIPPPKDEAETSSDDATAVMSYAEAGLDRPPDQPAAPATSPKEVSGDAETVIPPPSEEMPVMPDMARASKAQPMAPVLSEVESSEDETLPAGRVEDLARAEGLETADLEGLLMSEPGLMPSSPPGAAPIKIGSLPPPADVPTPPPSAQPLPAPVPLQLAPQTPAPPAPAAQQAAPQAPQPRGRKKSGLARAAAKASVGIAALVLFVVVALIGYRYSGIHEPRVDALLTTLGGHAPPETPPPDVPPVVETPVETPPVVETPPEPPVAPPEPVVEPPPEPVVETPPEPPPVEPPPVEPPSVEPPTPEPPTPEPPTETDEVQALIREARGLGNSDQAESLYRRALELDSREHHAMVGLARLLMERNRHADAVPFMRGAVARRPRRVPYLIWLGDALAGSGDAAAAHEQWQRGLELEPDNRLVQRRLGL